MPRPPRIQFAGANYHIVTRGDARRKLFHDSGHYERFTQAPGGRSTTKRVDCSHLVHRAERRRQSAEWRKTVREIEASLGLNTEHKA